MSRETISMEDQDTLKACHVLTTNQTLTVPSLLNILSKPVAMRIDSASLRKTG